MAFTLKRLILSLCLTLTTAKQEYESSLQALQFRCGYQIQISEEDARIDAYIEKLIAGVDESEISYDDDLLAEKEDTIQVAEGEEEENKDAPIEQEENEDEDSKKIIEAKAEKKIEEEIDQKKKDYMDGEAIQVRKSPRPNAIYRFLLGKGYIGQTLVMAMVFLSEFLHAFFPHIANILTLLISKILGVDASNKRGIYSSRREDDMLMGAAFNDQYAAFATDSRSIRGKQKKIISKKADKMAAEQLRRVGNLQKARYRHVSEDFLRRHKLGPFQIAESDIEGGDEDEEDADWVVEALTKDDNASNEPSVSVEFGNNGMEVGVGFSIGASDGKKLKSSNRTRKSRRASRSLIKAATTRSSSSRTPKGKVGTRVSDREGGGGVMGRLRNISTNNVVSRSLLGAYPGDALPPQAAASSNGVVDLASKYGYGDWSTDDKEDYRKNQRRKTKRRRPKSSSSSQSFKPKKIPQTINGDKREKSSEKSMTPQTTASDIEKSIATLKARNRKSKIVRLPTTLLKEKEEQIKNQNEGL